MMLAPTQVLKDSSQCLLHDVMYLCIRLQTKNEPILRQNLHPLDEPFLPHPRTLPRSNHPQLQGIYFTKLHFGCTIFG
jgi:hypothetical protein